MLKKRIKRWFNGLGTRDLNKIINKIKKYKYVSFDIFDTLIKRNVNSPKDIFKIVEVKYNNLHNIDSNFYKKRIEAETICRIKKKQDEITINDIYSFMDYNDTERTELMKIEFETELEYCVRNYSFYEIYKFCIENNKKIIIISDMYLPEDIIKQILQKNGYNKYDNLYVSSEYNLKKSNGKIFKYVLKEKNILSDEIIHIGDNIIADYIMPKLNRINSVLIRNKVKNNLFYDNKLCNSNLAYNIMMSSINNLDGISKKYLENVGISILTPLLYGFCNSLHNYLKENNIEKAFFLARDSRIILDSYLSIYKEDKEKCNYINISRKSITFASFSDNIDIKEFEEVADSIIKRKKIVDIIKILELDLNKYQALLISNKINIYDYYDSLNNEDKEILFDCIKNELQILCNQQKKMFKQFLKENYFEGNICVVDIGWKGTIQNKLEIFCKDNKISADIYGYYMGVYDKNKNRVGYIYNGSQKNKYMIYSSIGVFEILFLNNEGTTRYYKLQKEKIVPVKALYEQDKYTSIKIKYIQDCTTKIIGSLAELNLELNLEASFYNYKKMVCYSKLKFINAMKNLKFNDGVNYPLIEDKSIFFYLTHIKDLKKELLNSYYKIGFLKNIFKVKLPYNYILEKAYKKVKGER